LKKAYELCRDIDEKDIPIVALTLELTDFSIKLYGDRIVIDPEIRHGKPVIKGTRAQKDIIPGSLAGGMTVEEVAGVSPPQYLGIQILQEKEEVA